MMAAVLLLVAAALWSHPATASVVNSTDNFTNIECRIRKEIYNLEAAYRVRRTVRIFVTTESLYRECIVNLRFETSSVYRQPDLAPRFLLVNVESEQWRGDVDVMFQTLTKNYRLSLARYCVPDSCRGIIWTSVSLQLIFLIFCPFLPCSFQATFVLTEATNVCDVASRARELLVADGSSEYAFAPDVRHALLSPNNFTCTSDSEYSLTVRPLVAWSLLIITAVACPFSGCGRLLLNGRSCHKNETLQAPQQPGWSVTLQYVRYGNCTNDNTLYVGFVVSARVTVFRYNSSADAAKFKGFTTSTFEQASAVLPSSTTVKGLTARFLNASCESNVTASHTNGEQQVLDSATCVIVTAIVGTFSMAALVIGLAAALRARQQLHKALSRQPSLTPGLPMASVVSGKRGGKREEFDDAYEPLKADASDQHVYDQTVLSSA